MSHASMKTTGGRLLYAAALAGDPMDKFFERLLAARDPIGCEVLAGAIGGALALVDQARRNGGGFTTYSRRAIFCKVMEQPTAITKIEFARALTTYDMNYLSPGLSALASMITAIQPKMNVGI